MKNKFLIFSLVSILAIGGAGCGKGESSQADFDITKEEGEELADTNSSGIALPTEVLNEPEENAAVSDEESQEPSQESPETVENDNNSDRTLERATKPATSDVPDQSSAKPTKPTKPEAVNPPPSKTTEPSPAERETSSQTEPSKPSAETPAQPAQNQTKPESAHTCTWDSGRVTTSATCSNEGVKTYTCTGCGKIRTESIAKTSHNYVTETFPANCTKGKRTVTSCSICGDVQSETYSGGPVGHIWEKTYWPEAPTCRNGGYYYQTCSKCGEKGESGTDPALPHTYVATEICHGNCTDVTVIEYTCSSCGTNLGRDVHTEPNDHDWHKVSYEERNLITGEMETKTVIACSRCHQPQ